MGLQCRYARQRSAQQSQEAREQVLGEAQSAESWRFQTNGRIPTSGHVLHCLEFFSRCASTSLAPRHPPTAPLMCYSRHWLNLFR
jgi:hypothetical protein